MPVLLLVQEYVSPGVPDENTTLIGSPSHRVRLAGSFIVGPGVMVILKVWRIPGQPAMYGVTVIVANSVTPLGVVVVKLGILPVPEAPKPMSVLSLVQE